MPEAEQSEQADGSNLATIRHELAILCRRPRCRTLGWPRDWRPHSVVNPTDNDLQVFTDTGAWEFIAELLECGHPIEVIDLEQPRGKKGFVLLAAGGQGRPQIYMKLQLGSGRVLGRSFHYEHADGR